MAGDMDALMGLLRPLSHVEAQTLIDRVKAIIRERDEAVAAAEMWSRELREAMEATAKAVTEREEYQHARDLLHDEAEEERADNHILRAEVARERAATDISRSLADALREDNVRLRVERTAAMNERDALRAENDRLHEAMDARRFPIMVGRITPEPSPVRSVPWALAERAYMAYSARYGTDQSMERLAQRGGFGAGEMDEFAPGWRDEVNALQVLQGEVDRLHAAWAWLAKHPGWHVGWGAGLWGVGWCIDRPGENTRETLVDLRRPSPLEAVIAAMEHEAAQAAKEKADA